MIQYPIVNYYITIKFDDGNGGVKTEPNQKVIFQVSFHELNIDMLKIYATRFSMVYNEKGLICIIDFALQ